MSNQDWNDKLKKYRTKLVNEIVLTGLYAELRSTSVISEQIESDIKSGKDEFKQKEHLLDYIIKRPVEDKEKFCQALIKNNQGHIVSQYLKHGHVSGEKTPLYVDRLARSLKEHYQSEMSQVQRIPWIKEDKMDIEDMYVNVETVAIDTRGKQFTDPLHNLDGLFKPLRPGRPHRRILLEADAGLGKTTSLNKMAFEWAKDLPSTEFPKLYAFKVLLHVALRFVDSNPDSNKTLAELVLDQMPFLKTEGFTQTSLSDYIQQNPEDILVLLDGYDEYSGESSEINDILSWKSHRYLTVVTTSRPWQSSPLLDPSVTHLHAKLTGLNNNNQKQYIIRFFTREVTKCNENTSFQTENLCSSEAVLPSIGTSGFTNEHVSKEDPVLDNGNTSTQTERASSSMCCFFDCFRNTSNNSGEVVPPFITDDSLTNKSKESSVASMSNGLYNNSGEVVPPLIADDILTNKSKENRIVDSISNGLYTYIEEHNLKHITHIPMVLLFICYLWQDDCKSFPETITGIYDAIVKHIINRYTLTLHVKLDNVDIQKQLFDIGRLAIEGLCSDKNQLIFKESDLKDDFSLKTGILSTSRCKILDKTYAHKVITLLEFPHKTLQEFFTAFFICRILEDQCPATEDKQILDDYINITSFEELSSKQQVLMFMSGMTKIGCCKVLNNILDIDHFMDKTQQYDKVQQYDNIPWHQYNNVMCYCLQESIPFIDDISDTIINNIPCLVTSVWSKVCLPLKVIQIGTPSNVIIIVGEFLHIVDNSIVHYGNGHIMDITDEVSRRWTTLKSLEFVYLSIPGYTECEFPHNKEYHDYLGRCMADSSHHLVSIEIPELFVSYIPDGGVPKTAYCDRLEMGYRKLFSGSNLQSITINDMGHFDMVLGVMCEVVTNKNKITRIRLSFSNCCKCTAIKNQWKNSIEESIVINKFTSLRSLDLDIRNNYPHTSKLLVCLTVTLQHLTNLSELGLQFYEDCTMKKDEIVQFFQFLKTMKQLQTLKLMMIEDGLLYELSDVLPYITELERLAVIFNVKATDMIGKLKVSFIQSLRTLENLQELHFGFHVDGATTALQKWSHMHGISREASSVADMIKEAANKYIPHCKLRQD